jgi:hypothetical protein
MTAGWEWLDVTEKFFSILTSLALVFALLQLTQGRAAKHRDFENIYAQRYWALMDTIEGDPWQATSLLELSTKDRRRMTAYLQLCEDELDLRRNGYITTKTWGIWADGMRSQCDRPAYRECLAREFGQNNLPALREFLDAPSDLIHSSDPLKMSRMAKWWTGIGNTSWTKPKWWGNRSRRVPPTVAENAPTSRGAVQEIY